MRHIQNRIVLAGGSGNIGRSLIRYFREQGISCSVLSRSGKPVEGSVRTVSWLDGTDAWLEELTTCRAIVNLCGEPIAQRWDRDSLARIRDSRITPTLFIGHALSRLETALPHWIQISGTGFYGNRGEEVVDEDSKVGHGLLAELSSDWESAAKDTCPKDTKLALVRLGPVLDPRFGFLERLVRLTHYGLGGRAGSGRQWISWISSEDLARLMGFVLKEELEGVFNAVAPNPVRQVELSQLLRSQTGCWVAPTAPEILVRLLAPILHVDPSLVLDSLYAVPRRALQEGFAFQFPDLSAYFRAHSLSAGESWN